CSDLHRHTRCGDGGAPQAGSDPGAHHRAGSRGPQNGCGQVVDAAAHIAGQGVQWGKDRCPARGPSTVRLQFLDRLQSGGHTELGRCPPVVLGQSPHRVHGTGVEGHQDVCPTGPCAKPGVALGLHPHAKTARRCLGASTERLAAVGEPARQLVSLGDLEGGDLLRDGVQVECTGQVHLGTAGVVPLHRVGEDTELGPCGGDEKDFGHGADPSTAGDFPARWTEKTSMRSLTAVDISASRVKRSACAMASEWVSAVVSTAMWAALTNEPVSPSSSIPTAPVHNGCPLSTLDASCSTAWAETIGRPVAMYSYTLPDVTNRPPMRISTMASHRE